MYKTATSIFLSLITFGISCGLTAQRFDNINVGQLNKIIYVDQQPGSTLSTKASNACSALPPGGGILDFTGFGAGSQSVAATISCGSASKLVTFRFDPSTLFQPSNSSLNMFKISQGNTFDGLHIDTTNFPNSYSGNAIANNTSQQITDWRLKNTIVDMCSAGSSEFCSSLSGSTGSCLSITANSNFDSIISTHTENFLCHAGTASNGVNFVVNGSGWINGNQFSGIKVYYAKCGMAFNMSGTKGQPVITANSFADYFFEADKVNPSSAVCVPVRRGSVSNFRGNLFTNVSFWDLASGNPGVLISDDTAAACGNVFFGQVNGVIDKDTRRCSLSLVNQFLDTYGTTKTAGDLSGAGTWFPLSGGAYIIGGTGRLPANAAGNLFLAGSLGSPILGRIYVGDGSGWQLNFAKRADSKDTDLFQFKDSGSFVAFDSVKWGGGIALGSSNEAPVYEAGLPAANKTYTNTQVLTRGTATHSFANRFTYTSSKTFGCTCTDQTSPNACSATPGSATTVRLAGNGDDVLWLSCTGY